MTRYTFSDGTTPLTCLRICHDAPRMRLAKDMPVVVLEYALEHHIPIAWDWLGHYRLMPPEHVANACAAYRLHEKRQPHDPLDFYISWIATPQSVS